MKLRLTVLVLLLLAAGRISAQKPEDYRAALKRPLSRQDKEVLLLLARKTLYPENNVGFTVTLQDVRPECKYDPSKPATLAEVRKLEKQLKGNDADGFLYNEIGQLYKRLNMPAQAHTAFTRAEKIITDIHSRKPDSVKVNQDLAALYINMGKLPQAITRYEYVLQLKPNDTLTRQMLPMFYIMAGYSELALQYVRQEISQDSTCIVPYFYWGLTQLYRLMGTADFNKCARYKNITYQNYAGLEFLEATSVSQPDNYPLALLNNVFRLMALNLKVALESCNDPRLLQLSTPNLMMYSDLEYFFRKGLDNASWQDKYVFHKALGSIYLIRKEYARSREQIETALKQHPNKNSSLMTNNADLYDNILSSWLLEGDTAAAEKTLLRKIEDQPAVDPQAADYLALARFMAWRNDMRGMEKTLTDVLRLDSNATDLDDFRTVAALQKGNLDKAEKLLSEDFSKNPNNANTAILYGILHLLKNDTETGYLFLANAWRRLPEHPDLRHFFHTYFEPAKGTH